MKVLILVQAFNNGPYKEVTDLQKKTWDSVKSEDTRTVFYMADFNTETHFEGNDLYIKEVPYTPYGYIHFLKALIQCLKFEWDFVFKTNSSTYVDKSQLVTLASSFPKEKYVAGHPYWKQFGIENKDRNDKTGLEEFMWGDGYILSRDVAIKLVEMYSLNPTAMYVTDDVGVSYALHKKYEIKYDLLIGLYQEEGIEEKKKHVYRIIPSNNILELWDMGEYKKTINEIHHKLTGL